MKIELMQFNIGFIKHGDGGIQTYMHISEHVAENVDTTSIEDFVLYLITLRNKMISEMQQIEDRLEDMEKLKSLNLKTIDTDIFKLTGSTWDLIFKTYIGGLALLSVYDIDLFGVIGKFMLKHDKSADLLFTFGSESRNGTSVYLAYRHLVEELLLPKFSIKDVTELLKQAGVSITTGYVTCEVIDDDEWGIEKYTLHTDMVHPNALKL